MDVLGRPVVAVGVAGERDYLVIRREKCGHEPTADETRRASDQNAHRDARSGQAISSRSTVATDPEIPRSNEHRLRWRALALVCEQREARSASPASTEHGSACEG